jgi:hypothetical protein
MERSPTATSSASVFTRLNPLNRNLLKAWYSFALTNSYPIYVLCLCYIPLIQEKGLDRRFGGEYLAYKRNVPRWIPQLKPWTLGLDDRRRDHPD